MRAMLLNPPIHHYSGMRPYRMNPPLGLPIIAAVLNAAGHQAEVTDLEALGATPGRLTEVMRGQRARWPDVIGLTALSSSARGCRDAIAAIRAAGYDRRIVVGGVYATLFPEEPLAWGADAVVTGECEGNVAEVIFDGAGILRGVPLSTSEVPAPDWAVHSPPPESYGGNEPTIGHPEAITMWSRGCPWHCIFCGNTVFRHQPTRYRPPANVEAELRTLKARHIRALFVYDDELLGGPMPVGWLAELADRIAPLGLVWKAQGRCSRKHITRELLDAAHRAGCRAVMWGVESFSPKVLRAIRKATSVEDIWHTLRTAKEAGLNNWIFTMVGNYREEAEDLALTAKQLRAAYLEGLVDYRQTTVVTALPGTELWDIQKREGWWTEPPEAGPQMHQAYQSTPWLRAGEIGEWLHRFDDACPVNQFGRMV